MSMSQPSRGRSRLIKPGRQSLHQFDSTINIHCFACIRRLACRPAGSSRDHGFPTSNDAVVGILLHLLNHLPISQNSFLSPAIHGHQSIVQLDLRSSLQSPASPVSPSSPRLRHLAPMGRPHRRLVNPLRDPGPSNQSAKAPHPQLPRPKRTGCPVANLRDSRRTGLQHRQLSRVQHGSRGSVAHDHRPAGPGRRRRAG